MNSLFFLYDFNQEENANKYNLEQKEKVNKYNLENLHFRAKNAVN